MRVIVNQTSALAGLRTGVGHHTAQLLRCLHAQTPKGTIEAYPGKWLWKARNSWHLLHKRLHNWTANLSRLNKNSQRSRVSPGRMIRSGLIRVNHYGFAPILRYGLGPLARALFLRDPSWKKYDLYHEPNFTPLPVGIPTVTTVHDLSVVLHPEWHPPERVAHYDKHFADGVARSRHFLTVSEFSRQEIIRTLGVSPDRVTCTYNGIRADLGPLPAARVAATLRALGLPPRYLLYVGTIEPRKNILRLLMAYCALPGSLRDRWPLLLVGSWGWKAADVADYYESQARHRGVIQVGYLPDEHLAAVYNGARALVFPSFYEGFGLPPVEMMACGGAVITSKAGALVEVVGARAHLVAPEDTEGWRDALKRVVSDDDWWHELRRGVREVARPFTWEQCAADTLRVYRRLCGEDGGASHTPKAASLDRPPRAAG
jgi:alpha-1,3-rhamnosyl/mannosyltransferase